MWSVSAALGAAPDCTGFDLDRIAHDAKAAVAFEEFDKADQLAADGIDRLECTGTATREALAALWQVRGTVGVAKRDTDGAHEAMRQACAVGLGAWPSDLVSPAAESAYRAACTEPWAAALLDVTPVPAGGRVDVDGERYDGSALRPGIHLAQVRDGAGAVVWTQAVDAAAGENNVDTGLAVSANLAVPAKTSKGRPLRVLSVVGLGAAVVLGGVALGTGSGVSSDLADTPATARDSAWRGDIGRRWDMSTTLGWSAAAVGVASAAGFGISFAGRF